MTRRVVSGRAGRAGRAGSYCVDDRIRNMSYHIDIAFLWFVLFAIHLASLKKHGYYIWSLCVSSSAVDFP